MREPSTSLDQITHDVIGAAIEVHRHLGPGFLESIYEHAPAIELAHRDLVFDQQLPIEVLYKGHRIAQPRLDFVVEGVLVLELKAVEALHRVHAAQLMSYLKAGRFQLGLLINFNVPVLKEGIRRVISS